MVLKEGPGGLDMPDRPEPGKITDPVTAAAWAKLAALKGQLATLGLERERLERVLDKVHWQEVHLTNQFKCLRGFLAWQKSLADAPTPEAGPEVDDDDPDDMKYADLHQAEVKP